MTAYGPPTETPENPSQPTPGSRMRRLLGSTMTGKKPAIFALGVVAVAAVAVVLVVLLTSGNQDQTPRESSAVTRDGSTALSAFPTSGPFGAPGAVGAPSGEFPAFSNQDEGGFGFGSTGEATDAAKSFPSEAPPIPAPQFGVATNPSGQAGGRAGPLDLAQRQVISQGSLSIEVETVSDAVDQVRAIAESLGGFVEQLSSSGVGDSQYSTLTIRVPQSEFFAAFDRIKQLGEVVNENAGSEDVTEQFIDLEARLKSAQQEEESLLSLLGRAEQVGDVLTIERELSRVRSELERLQGQLNFLQRRVDLATITVALSTPQVRYSEPPSASVALETKDVAGSVEDIKALITGAGGELDQVYTSVRDGVHRARLSVRVFDGDFERVLASVESHGRVTAKEVNEGSSISGADSPPPDEPRSRISIELVEAQDQGASLWLTVGAPIGGVAAVLLLASLFYAAYRAGRRALP